MAIAAMLDNILEKKEVRLSLRRAANETLAYCNAEERPERQNLLDRALRPQCEFDRRNRLMLYALAVAPEQVGWKFKMRERCHRLFHKEHSFPIVPVPR
jgi:hypothetical protein